eukprot:915185_1
MEATPRNEYKDPQFPDMKYVIITGGVVSGLGKGITASSIGLLLKQAGLRVTAIKIDPYLNIDAGTMSPYEHGEVFVLDDGGEVDLDLGNYERFLNVRLTRDHNITTGKIYERVLKTERDGDYLGKTVQMVPHVSNCIQDWIEEVAIKSVDGSGTIPDVCVIELGGTVGDIESMIYLEAIRQFKFRCGDSICHVHVSLIPCLGNVGELKSKPTQHSMTQLRTAGLIPDIVVLRCSTRVTQNIINKVSLFSMVPKENIIGVHDVSNIYQVPQLLLEQNIAHMVLNKIGFENMLRDNVIDINNWKRIANMLTDDELAITKTITIGIVGKYTGLTDSYLSVTKALLSAALESNLKLQIIWIESSHLETVEMNGCNNENINYKMNGNDIININIGTPSPDRSRSPSIEEMKDAVHNISIYSDTSPHKKHSKTKEYSNAWNKLKSVDGILIPGGFGDRGIEGKILAVNYARINKIPFLGICLGMQMAVIEFCRNVLQLYDSNSTEFDEYTKNPCVIFMPEGDKNKKGGTMRLGSRKCHLNNKSIAKYLYLNEIIKEQKNNIIYERHRHRYEVNPDLVEKIEEMGLIFTGKDEKYERMEIIELPLNKHPFFFGCQFHPEFKSGPLRPSPPFQGLIKAASGLLHKEKEFIKEFGQIKTDYKHQDKPMIFPYGKLKNINEKWDNDKVGQKNGIR